MIAKLLLDKKREGHALGSAEIREFIDGFTKGEIPDYQMSAMAMAICCRGMNERETADLTEAMMNSGRSLKWDFPTADKHSTGGVGDKLSFIIQPLAAACGINVPSLTGRGLGLTGGTADKLESIPGLTCSLPLDRFQSVVKEVGLSLALQTDEICPADKKLYALRDVTGTVTSIPLIVGSILSKKFAEGSGTLVFDVKTGRGAFMKTKESAVELATAMVKAAQLSGRKSAALVTDMDSPLGYAVGNANEVKESLDILSRADKGLEDIRDLSVEFAALMVSLTKGISLDDAREMCAEKLADGSALAKFKAMVAAQGGDLDRFARLLEKPTFKFCIQAPKSGYVEDIDAEKVARVAFRLGAGREKAGDRIDPLAGVKLAARIGDKVSTGSALATLESSSEPDGLERNAAELLKAFSIVSGPVVKKSLIIERIS
ncbi:MAG: thymidine phosphorylase [Kiritimatiellae bacterium]|nr:thymidine phosphorylase [Kiritimatiellia bacterium]